MFLILRLVFSILITVGLILYRKHVLKTINLEKKNSESSVFCLGYDKLSNLMLICLAFDLIVGIMANPERGIAKNIVSLGTIFLLVLVIIYSTKTKIKNTVIIRNKDLILFTSTEKRISFDEISDVSIEVAENPYVYLITLTLKNGQDYKISGRDQYEMNKTVGLIKKNIGKEVLKE